ncbi:unnamed protein product, partial [Effrenium voratum]
MSLSCPRSCVPCLDSRTVGRPDWTAGAMQAPPAWLMAMMARMPAPLQQRVQALLMRAMQDMYLPALATVPVAWFLAYVPHFMKFGVILSKQRVTEYNNQDPRSTDYAQFGPSEKLIRRLLACHQNALEGFPAFAFAVLMCKMQKVKPLEAFQLCLRYLIARVL